MKVDTFGILFKIFQFPPSPAAFMSYFSCHLGGAIARVGVCYLLPLLRLHVVAGLLCLLTWFQHLWRTMPINANKAVLHVTA